MEISPILTFVLAVCAILITTAIVVGAYFLLGIIRDIQILIRTLHTEVETLRSKRRGIEVGGRTLLKVAKYMLMRRFLRK
jgi:hypothetical protein